jgi:hypothetical protein
MIENPPTLDAFMNSRFPTTVRGNASEVRAVLDMTLEPETALAVVGTYPGSGLAIA